MNRMRTMAENCSVLRRATGACQLLDAVGDEAMLSELLAAD